MRTRVEFRSRDFPPYGNEAAEINPGRFGKRLAEFIASELPNHGFKVRSIGAEDWGWVVQLEHDAFALWIGCGNSEGSGDEFQCFIEPSKPVIRKRFSSLSEF